MLKGFIAIVLFLALAGIISMVLVGYAEGQEPGWHRVWREYCENYGSAYKDSYPQKWVASFVPLTNGKVEIVTTKIGGIR